MIKVFPLQNTLMKKHTFKKNLNVLTKKCVKLIFNIRNIKVELSVDKLITRKWFNQRERLQMK